MQLQGLQHLDGKGIKTRGNILLLRGLINFILLIYYLEAPRINASINVILVLFSPKTKDTDRRVIGRQYLGYSLKMNGPGLANLAQQPH